MINFDFENILGDWLSFNLEGLINPEIIAPEYFTPHVIVNDKSSIRFHNLKKKYKVSIRSYSRSNYYWVGSKVIFSRENAAYFYELIETQKFDWSLLNFDHQALRLGRIDLCFYRPTQNFWNLVSFTKAFI